jgi:hypothetical protein
VHIIISVKTTNPPITTIPAVGTEVLFSGVFFAGGGGVCGVGLIVGGGDVSGAVFGTAVSAAVVVMEVVAASGIVVVV